jgi:DNA-binding MarR family transcriptional regulator
MATESIIKLTESCKLIMELWKPQKAILQHRPYAEYLLVSLLMKSENGIRAKDLAEKISLSAPSLSRLLNRLEDENTIERFRKPGNRKEIFVRLTESRTDDLRNDLNFMRSIMERVSEIMGEEDVSLLADLLVKIHSALKSVLTDESIMSRIKCLKTPPYFDTDEMGKAE